MVSFTPMLFALAVLPLAAARRAPGDTRPNLIVYIPDTIRAEALSVHGQPFIKTPNVERLARRGVVFNEAHVQHTQCSPSREAIITGRYLHVLGHRTQTHLVQAVEPNAFRYLKESGYTTMLLGKNDMLSQDSFNSSFDYWDEVIGVGGGPSPFAYGSPGYYAFAGSASKQKGNESLDYQAAALVSAWMREDPPEPFAVWVSGIGAHPPYDAPKDYYDMYSAAQVHTGAPLRPYSPSSNKPAFIGPNGIPGFRNLNSFNESFFESLAAVYYGRVSFMDVVLGALMDGIDAAPAAVGGNTALIFTSDHGDFAGDYHNVEKYPCALDDVLTHVPLMVAYPGGLKGVRIAAPVESLDIFATLLDAAGILGNETSGVERHFSQSLLPLVTSASPPVSPLKRFVFSEGGYSPGTIEVESLDPAQKNAYEKKTNMYYPRGQEELVAAHCTRAIMMRNASAKLVYRAAPGQSELYDMVADPRELQNQWGTSTYAALQGEMVLGLLEWLSSTSDITPLIEDARNCPPSPKHPPFPWPPTDVDFEAMPEIERPVRPV